MSEIKLKPIYCPCCGSCRTKMVMVISGTQYAVMCDACGLISGGSPTKEEAIEAWNRRVPIWRIVEKLEEQLEKYGEKWVNSKIILQDAIEIVQKYGGAG